ncbi:thiosulfate sulfurtransferase GlpE [Tolumonas lignilytica]|uniref:thiosulfate sulfurtransferase GlpE n=1 Tax=Tolumonas lignilytica TaxID=1283284 RepID=UPI0004661BD8|nr:thiosulfate sulfurtransferase GlpE [Tolumonas lignilytica]
MTQFTRISIQQAAALLKQSPVCLADIRDAGSYNAAHVAGAYHLTNDTLSQFTQSVAKDTPVLVMCYHGNSSQGAANYLVSLGYQSVYSIDGGFESWRHVYPFTATV